MTDQLKTPSSNGAGADIDAAETSEWLEAVDAIVEHDGPDRARQILARAVQRAELAGSGPIASITTPYVNTIPPDREARLPGDPALERRLRSIIRWNAIAMVVRANKLSSELGGHIASFQSLATLYEVGYNHFWHAPSGDHGGDLVYFQGHSSPGNYARAYLEGRLTEDQLDNFRQEVAGGGLSSYPHPWLMPEFWQFPTVSLGIGAITSIYQARFMKYLEARDMAQTSARKVWAFLGDGEMDEPETMGATALAGREQLDNLIWIVNCNLQRLDGPVRGNGKIIQELEADFRGAGWNVIKVVWGSRWDPLLAEDTDGRLVKVMEECVDGEYQTYKSRDGAYVREHFFGKDPVLLERVSHMSDDEIWLLNRGGLDQQKVYAAYHAAVEHPGQPTVILAKTIKGYGMGVSGEGQMITHQAKKMTEEALLAFRDRFELPLTDEQVRAAEYYKPPEDSPEMRFLRERRAALGGRCRPAVGRRRSSRCRSSSCSRLSWRAPAIARSRPRWRSSASWRRCCATSGIGRHVVPIVPDESRTFGMEGMFRQVGIYSAGRAALPAPGLRAADVLQRGQARPDPRGGDHRGRVDLLVHRRRHVVHRPRRPDGAVLHLLLDVRLTSGSAISSGRPADSPHARLHARRHRRPDDAQRRGAPARGRAQPPAVQRRPQLPRLRPDVRLRGRGDHPGRPAADGRRAGGRLLLPHADERELPRTRRCPRAPRRGSCAGCTCCAKGGRPQEEGRRCSCSARARSCARCSPPPSCSSPTSASLPTCGA